MGWPPEEPPIDDDLLDVAALADGSLPPERVAAVRARIAESPELSRAYARQLYAVAAVRAANSAESATYHDPRYSRIEILCLAIGVVALAILLVYVLVLR